MRPPDESRRHHQPPAARWRHGLRALARQAVHRAPAKGRPAAAPGAVEVDAEYREVVISGNSNSPGPADDAPATDLRKPAMAPLGEAAPGPSLAAALLGLREMRTGPRPHAV